MTSSTTLSEIWRSWGMRSTNDEAKAQKEALAALEKHLRSGSAVLVRGAQALLLDPETPGAAKRPLLATFWRVVDSAWSSAGTANTHLLALQAMLLVCWPEDSNHSGLVSSLLSPWEHLRGRGLQKERLVQWRDERATESFFAVENEKNGVDLSQLGAAYEALAEYRQTNLEKSCQSTRSVYDHNSLVMTPETGTLLQEDISVLSKGITEFAKDVFVGLDSVATSLQDSATTNPQDSAADPRSEYLWWGQARYSHLARKPFRRMDDSTEALWFAAREAAERACKLPMEPSASYLQETLFSLGRSPSEKKPLVQWLSELRPVITNHPEDPLGADLVKLVREDALGLPVTQLCADLTVSEADLKNVLGAPAEAELDAGQWAAWVFRELVFQRRWQESST